VLLFEVFIIQVRKALEDTVIETITTRANGNKFTELLSGTNAL
jgi:hypothetical protein